MEDNMVVVSPASGHSRTRKPSKASMIVVAIVVGIIGVYALIHSFAASSDPNLLFNGSFNAPDAQALLDQNNAGKFSPAGTPTYNIGSAKQFVPGHVTVVPDPLNSDASHAQKVVKMVVANTDVAPLTPTENPRAQLIGPDDINPGDDIWVKTKFLLPNDFPSNVPGWMSLMGVYGPPYAGSGPWEVAINGNHFEWDRNGTYHYDVPWSMPIIKNQWVNVLLHQKFDTNGFVEMWINGQQVTFFDKGATAYYNPNNVSSTTRLAMQTMDSSNNGGGNSVRLAQYRQKDILDSVTTYFGPLIVGKTREAVDTADTANATANGGTTTPQPGGGGSTSTAGCNQVVNTVAAAQTALNSASAGQTICLADGTYGKLTLNSTKSAPGVTVRAQNPGKATIAGATLSGAYITLAQFNITNSVDIQPGASAITVSHNFITGGYMGVTACTTTTTPCNDIKIIGNKFQGPYGEDAIRANRYEDTSADTDTDGLTVSQNEITAVRENGNHSDCLQTVWVGHGITFDHNYVHDTRCQGFFIKDQNSLCGPGVTGVCGTVNNVNVNNNLFTRNNEPCAPEAPGCGQPVTVQLFGPIDGLKMNRNTIWGGDVNLTLRDPGWSNVSVTNNVVNRKWSDTSAPFNSTYSASNNLFCNTTYSGSWPDTGFTSNCNPPFPGPNKAGGDDFRLGGSQGVDWAPGQYVYGPETGGVSTPPPSDTTKPTVALTAPASGSNVSGQVSLAATASDDSGTVAKVEFYADGDLIDTDNTAPYTATWNTSGIIAGAHTLTAKAYDAANNSATSAPVIVNTASAAPPPGVTPPDTSITAKPAASTVNTSATFSFSASQNGASFQCKLDTGTFATCTSPKTYTGLSVGSHTFSVRALDTAGNVDTTPATYGWTVTAPPPATKPTISLTAPQNGSTVSGIVTATALVTGPPEAVTKVEFLLDDTTKLADPTSPYNYAFDSTGLTNGAHTLGAKAYDTAGNSYNAANVAITVNNPDTTPPAAPTNLKASISGTDVALSWSGSTDSGSNASGVAKYNILRDGAVIAQSNTPSYTDTGRAAGATYAYAVQAVDGAGNISANSNTATVKVPVPTPKDTTPPTTPAKLTATAISTSQVNLTWNASTDEGGSGIKGYNVYRGGTKLNAAPITTTSYGDTGLKASTTYKYSVEAVDGAGNKSPRSKSASVTTQNAPSKSPHRYRHHFWFFRWN